MTELKKSMVYMSKKVLKLTITALLFTLFCSFFGVSHYAEASIKLTKAMDYKTKPNTSIIEQVTSNGSMLLPVEKENFEDDDVLSALQLISKDGKLLWTYKTSKVSAYGMADSDTIYLMKGKKSVVLLSIKTKKAKTYTITDKSLKNLHPIKTLNPRLACYTSEDYDYMKCIDLKTKKTTEYKDPREINTLINTNDSYVYKNFPNEEISGKYLTPISDDQDNILPKDYQKRNKTYNGYWQMSSGRMFYESNILYYYQSDRIESKNGRSYSDATLFAVNSKGKKIFETNGLGGGGLWVENGKSYIGSVYADSKGNRTCFVKILNKSGKVIYSLKIPNWPSRVIKHKDRLIVQGDWITSYKIKE